MKCLTIIEPRYHETDAMGVIHHAVYPVWYEVGRVDFLDETKTSYQDINHMGYHMALVDMHVNYAKPAFFGQKYQLYTWIDQMTKMRVKIAYKIYNMQDELINYGYTTHVFVNNDLKLVNMAKENPALYRLFADLVEKEKA